MKIEHTKYKGEDNFPLSTGEKIFFTVFAIVIILMGVECIWIASL